MSHSDTSPWKQMVETLCMWWCSLPHCVMCSSNRQYESLDREHWKPQPAVKLPLGGRKSLQFRKSFSLESLLFPVASGAGAKIFQRATQMYVNDLSLPVQEDYYGFPSSNPMWDYFWTIIIIFCIEERVTHNGLDTTFVSCCSCLILLHYSHVCYQLGVCFGVELATEFSLKGFKSPEFKCAYVTFPFGKKSVGGRHLTCICHISCVGTASVLQESSASWTAGRCLQMASEDASNVTWCSAEELKYPHVSQDLLCDFRRVVAALPLPMTQPCMKLS